MEGVAVAFDELDAELEAMVAAHEAVNLNEEPSMPPEERVYEYRGEQCTESELRGKCPYLRNMGETAFQQVIASYEVEPPRQQQTTELVRADNLILQKREAEPVEVEIQVPVQRFSVDQIEQRYQQTQLEQAAASVTHEPDKLVEMKTAPAVGVPPLVETKAPKVIETPKEVIFVEPIDHQPERAAEAEIEVSPIVEAMPERIEMIQPAPILVAKDQPLPVLAELPPVPEVREDSEVENIEEAAPPTVEQDLADLIEHVGSIEVLEAAIPVFDEAIQEQIDDFVEAASPEEQEHVSALTLLINASAARLQELAIEDMLDDPEAEQIQLKLEVWYDELLTTLGIEHDEETVKKFVLSLIEESLAEPEHVSPEAYDEGTHEQKPGIFTLAGHLFGDGEANNQTWRIGRFILQLSQANTVA